MFFAEVTELHLHNLRPIFYGEIDVIESPLLLAAIGMMLLLLIIALLLLARQNANIASLQAKLAEWQNNHGRLEAAVRSEIADNRKEISSDLKQSRDELTTAI